MISLRPPLHAAVSLPDGRADRDCISPTLLTTYRAHATRFASSLFEGRLRRHPEGGAGSGVSRRRLVTVASGGREAARQALRPGCEELAVTDPLPAEAQAEGDSGERSAAPGAQNRHGGAPRGERPASWDARRLARRLACRVTCTPHGCSAEHPNVSRRSAHPSTGVSEAKRQSPDAAMRARERDGLFDIVRIANARAVAPVWSFT